MIVIGGKRVRTSTLVGRFPLAPVASKNARVRENVGGLAFWGVCSASNAPTHTRDASCVDAH